MQIWVYWYILSIILFFLEGLAIPGVGLFFAAIGALFTGLLIQLEVIDGLNTLAQVAAFFLLTGLATAALWKPLKKWRVGKAETHNNMVGRLATVAEGGLKKGEKGQATWSGTVMTARLAPDAAVDNIPVGKELKIVDVQGSTLILAEETYTVKNATNA